MKLLRAAVVLALASGSALVAQPASAAGVLIPGQFGMVLHWGTDVGVPAGQGGVAPVPTVVPGLPTDIVQLSPGVLRALAVRADGTVWQWGSNLLSPQVNAAPAPVAGLSRIVKVSAGNAHALALDADGFVWSWGESNADGQLGNGTRTSSLTPARIGLLANVVQVAAADHRSFAVRGDGTVWAWGRNSEGYLGDGTIGTDRLLPIQLPGLPFITQISASSRTALAVSADKRVYGWGANGNGQLGDGSSGNDRYSPVPAAQGLDRVKQVSAEFFYSVAVREDGTVYAWGENKHGEFGDGTVQSSRRLVPGPVPGLTGVTRVSAGVTHVLAMRPGEVLAWGRNYEGQIGDGTTSSTPQLRPLVNRYLKNVTAVMAGPGWSMAIVGSPPDFSVELAPPSGLVRAGDSTSTTVTVRRVNGFTAAVPLSVTGAPSGVSAVLSGTSTLVITTSGVALNGTFPLTVTGSPAGRPSRSRTYALTVVEGSELGCTNTNNADTAIPDNGSAVISVTPLFGCDHVVSPTSAVVDVHIVHPRRGDLVIELIDPRGTAHPLKDRNLADTGADVHETFSVDLATDDADGSVAMTNKLGGSWILRVRDVVAGGTGFLDRWTLVI